MLPTPHRTSWSARHPGRLVGLAIAVLGAGACDNFTGPDVPELTDGDYHVRLQAPVILDEFVTPGWMRTEPSIDFTIRAGVLTVTASGGNLVATGPAQLFRADPDNWLTEFSWSELQDGDHYWSVELRGSDCGMAKAVDADLGHGLNGVFTVELRRCTLERR